VQYCTAVGLLHGKLEPRDFEDDFAADPRIDRLRENMVLTEDARYSREFFDPSVRSSANAMQVRFKDGSSTPKVEVEFPVGHQRRRAEAAPGTCERSSKQVCAAVFSAATETHPGSLRRAAGARPHAGNEFVDLFVADLPR